MTNEIVTQKRNRLLKRVTTDDFQRMESTVNPDDEFPSSLFLAIRECYENGLTIEEMCSLADGFDLGVTYALEQLEKENGKV